MDNSKNSKECVATESDKNRIQVLFGNSSELPIASLLDEGMLRFKLSDENIRQTITKNAFIVLNNVWKNLASEM